MVGRSGLMFSTPHRGCGIQCAARVTERADIRSVRVIEAQPESYDGDRADAWREVGDAAIVLNKLLYAGVPWSTLAQCKSSAGAIGALIEAAETRRQDLVASLTSAEAL